MRGGLFFIVLDNYGHLILLISQKMRSHPRTPKVPEKPFIHTYHINEVPLPYYNPLEDPHLKNFFSNRKVSKHVENMGYVYQPSNNYPYHERRTKNAYRFLKKNCNVVPRSHILSQSERGDRSCIYSSSKDDFAIENQSTKSHLLLKRKSDSEFLNKINSKLPFLADIVSNRPSTQNNNRRMVQSSEGRNHSSYFRKRDTSSKNNKEEDKESK